LAVSSNESRSADASVLVNSINALSVVLARVSSAIINVDFAVGSSPSGSAVALVGVDEIFTFSGVLAWRRCLWQWSGWSRHQHACSNNLWDALINVDFAVLSFESSGALAEVVVDSVHADTAVLTWLGSALVNVDFAVESRVSSSALAFVFGDSIMASSSVLARVSGAIINVGGAGSSGESDGALACVFVDSVNARGAVLALVVDAFINVGFTVVA
jgi:hypothetical protein